MDAEFLGRVFARLRPFIRDGVIRRTRLERVLGSLQSTHGEVRAQVDALLRTASIAIEEDLPEASAPLDTDQPPAPDVRIPDAPGSGTAGGDESDWEQPEAELLRDLPQVRVSEAVFAARRRLERDRFVSNHSKILLGAEEEVGLAILVRGPSGGPLAQGEYGRLTGEARAAADCLFLHNQGLVHSAAQRLAPSGMTYEDVAQHGFIGLVRAVELFDPTLGYKFSTYAMHWIRQAISRGIANDARLIRLPVHMFERVNKVWSARSRLSSNGEAPSVHELALACGLPDAQVMECLALGPQDVASLDAPVGVEGEATLGDLLSFVDHDTDPARQVEQQLLREELDEVLSTLTEREAGVVSMRYGLDDGDEKTLDHIGRHYGVTRERIRQIEKKTMTKLRHRSRSASLASWMPAARPLEVEDRASAE